GHLGGRRRAAADRGRATLLEPSEHEGAGCHAQEVSSGGPDVALRHAICRHTGRVRAAAGAIRHALPPAGPKGGGAPGAGLGATDHLLPVPARTLAPPADDEWGGVSRRGSAVAHNGGETVQEGRG